MKEAVLDCTCVIVVELAMIAALFRPRNLLELRYVPSLSLLAANPASRPRPGAAALGRKIECAFLTTDQPAHNLILFQPGALGRSSLYR